MFSLYYSWVWNKSSPCLLILNFFPNPQCLFGHPPPSPSHPHCFIIPNIFVLTFTEIDDLNTNIQIWKYQLNFQLSLLLRAPSPCLFSIQEYVPPVPNKSLPFYPAFQNKCPLPLVIPLLKYEVLIRTDHDKCTLICCYI